MLSQSESDYILISPLLRKNYVVSMKKFLGRVSPIDSLSELEQRSSMDINPEKIKALLNVDQYPEALAKLYRIISKTFMNHVSFVKVHWN